MFLHKIKIISFFRMHKNKINFCSQLHQNKIIAPFLSVNYELKMVARHLSLDFRPLTNNFRNPLSALRINCRLFIVHCSFFKTKFFLHFPTFFRNFAHL